VDYWLHKGDYGDESIFYDTRHQRWQGALAMAIGLVVSIGLFSNNAIYTGPIPKANAQFGDITFIVGFVVTAALYYAFAMATRKQASAAPSPMGTRA
jgi:purine-cytosine permease-like protein